MKILNDNPIDKSENDILNRNSIAKQISDCIVNNTDINSLVIALEGKWGSGKTSILNMVIENIQKEAVKVDGRVIKPIMFMPWNITNQDGIITQFFKTLLSNFNKRNIRKFIKSVMEQVELAVTILSNLSITSTVIVDSIKKLKNLFSKYEKSVIKGEESLISDKKNVEEKLKESKVHFVVFIDDLDRLNDSETKLVFQLIKSVCGFSNITYVLAYDRDIVSEALGTEQKGVTNGNEYLEKIVQVSFRVPEIKDETIKKIADKDLKTLVESKGKSFDEARYEMLKTEGLFKTLHSIREEKRFINYLSFILDSFLDEIDLVDLIGISYLRFIDEGIIDIIKSHFSYLAGKDYYINDADSLRNSFEAELSKTKYQLLENNYLYILFPNMFSNSTYKLLYDFDSKKNYLRIYNYDIFYLFLHYDKREKDIFYNNIEHIIKKRDKIELGKFVDGLNEEQGRSYLNWLVSFLKSIDDYSSFAFILPFFFKNISKIKITKESGLDGKDFYLFEVISILFNNCGNKANKLLEEIINETDELYPMLCLSRDLIINGKRGFNFDKIDNELQMKIKDRTFELFKKQIEEDIYSLDNDINPFIDFYLQFESEGMGKIISKKDNIFKIELLNRMMIEGEVSSVDGLGNVKTAPFYKFKDIYSLSKYYENLDELLNVAGDEKKTAIIVFMMNKESIPVNPYCDGYAIEDIKKYCYEKKIDFNE